MEDIHYWGEGGTILFCGEELQGYVWTSLVEETTCKKCLMALVGHHNEMSLVAIHRLQEF